jgi:hypothetical protein
MRAQVDSRDQMLGAMGVYGLGLLLLFVGRSHAYNLFHPMVPFAIVIVLLADRSVGFISVSANWAMLVTTAMVMLAKPEFVGYPSLLRTAFSPIYHGVYPLNPRPLDLSMDEDHKTQAAEIIAVVDGLRQLHSTDIAILDDHDTLYYYLADLCPWSRYSSLFQCIFTRDQLGHARKDLLTHRPMYVLIRSKPPLVPKDWNMKDLWTTFHDVMPGAFDLQKTANGYEIWKRRPRPTTHPATSSRAKPDPGV